MHVGSDPSDRRQGRFIRDECMYYQITGWMGLLETSARTIGLQAGWVY